MKKGILNYFSKDATNATQRRSVAAASVDDFDEKQKLKKNPEHFSYNAAAQKAKDLRERTKATKARAAGKEEAKGVCGWVVAAIVASLYYGASHASPLAVPARPLAFARDQILKCPQALPILRPLLVLAPPLLPALTARGRRRRRSASR